MMRMRWGTIKMERRAKMSDVGLFNALFETNMRSLETFDEAIKFFKKHNKESSVNKQKAISALTNVLSPIVEAIDKRPGTSTAVNEVNILNILQKTVAEKRGNDWHKYQAAIKLLLYRITSEDVNLTDAEYALLNDIGDALDIECNRYYQRIRGKS